MLGVKQEYQYSTVVAESTKVDEFIVEFTPLFTDVGLEDIPVKITRNFDELLDFLESIDINK